METRAREMPGEDAAAPATPREMASGIDALSLSGYGDVSPALLADLESAKCEARAANEPVPLQLDAVTVLVDGRGLNKYPFRLMTPHGLIGVTDSTRLPPVQVQPLAEHLHAVGPGASVAWFSDIVASFTRGLRLSASRVDVFSDWQGWVPNASDRHRFVGRSAKVHTREEAGAWTGFDFGRRTSGTVLARIYDKTKEVEAKGGSYWPEIWRERGERYEADQPVTRVEFEYHRQALREHGVDSASDALQLAPALWVTGTTDWLSLRTPTADGTRSRWPVDPDWQRIQRPSFAGRAAGLERIRAARGEATLRAIRPGVIGYLSTMAALVGVTSVEELAGPIAAMSRDYELVSRVSFADRVAAKRRKLRLETA